jgi:hypothetical protein
MIAVVTISINTAIMVPLVNMFIVFWQVKITWFQTQDFAHITFLLLVILSYKYEKYKYLLVPSDLIFISVLVHIRPEET